MTSNNIEYTKIFSGPDGDRSYKCVGTLWKKIIDINEGEVLVHPKLHMAQKIRDQIDFLWEKMEIGPIGYSKNREFHFLKPENINDHLINDYGFSNRYREQYITHEVKTRKQAYVMIYGIYCITTKTSESKLDDNRRSNLSISPKSARISIGKIHSSINDEINNIIDDAIIRGIPITKALANHKYTIDTLLDENFNILDLINLGFKANEIEMAFEKGDYSYIKIKYGLLLKNTTFLRKMINYLKGFAGSSIDIMESMNTLNEMTNYLNKVKRSLDQQFPDISSIKKHDLEDQIDDLITLLYQKLADFTSK